jgi:SAM-dependent methyltransferase
MSTDDSTIKSYSEYAEKWATHMRSGKNIAHEYMEKPSMYARLPDLKGRTVLCVGCGTGEECAHLTSLGAKVMGIDISEGLIEYAKKSYPNLEFHVMDMEKLDFPDATFDFIYSSLVMHYISSWEKTLQNIHRALKPGGTFLFSTHHPVTYGAQRSRSETERSSMLGYTKHYDTHTADVVGDYLGTRKIDDVWFGDFPISYIHRPMQDLMRDILSSPLTLVDFEEPKAIEKCKDVDPSFYEIHQKIPQFMIFELKKN